VEFASHLPSVLDACQSEPAITPKMLPIATPATPAPISTIPPIR